jgi:hypothetical protein
MPGAAQLAGGANDERYGKTVERRGFIKAGAAGAMLSLMPPLARAATARRDHDFYFTRLAYGSGDWEAAPGMAAHVLRTLAAASTLRVDPLERVVALDDARMLAAPFCFLGGSKLVQFSAIERRHLERYVRGGGFLFVDGCGPGAGGLFARSFEAELARLFGARALQRLAPSHPLYSSFYRFDGAPPTGREPAGDGAAPRHLSALLAGDRVRVLYSNKNYPCEWEGGAADSLRFAVNIIHYALGA